LVRNLLHNAIKHAPDGTPLSVTLTRAARDAELRIDDQGPGISTDLRQRLFQPFAVGGNTGDPRIGSGLGLAIGQEIARSLGGSIALDNRTDGGRVVGLRALVRLPVVDNPG
jgi:two-component system sensor histidine kinase TctE